MKKLLALTFVLLFAIGAFAQERPDMLFFIGTVDGSNLTVGINKWIPVKVWYQATDQVDDSGKPVEGADLCMPLGINNCYVDEFNTAACTSFYPLTGWDSYYFDGLNENWMNDGTCDWDSYSFQGFAETSQPYESPLMGEQSVPTHIITFLVHTVDEASLVGNTYEDCIGPGDDPLSGPPNCGDPTGGPGYDCILTYSPFFFSPNQGVEIIPVSETPAEICTYGEAEYLFDVVDPDGDNVFVSSTIGTVEFLSSTPDEDPLSDAVTYHYALVFNRDAFCGECVSGDIVITAYDYIEDPGLPNNDPVELEAGTAAYIGVLEASMNDALWIWPGDTGWMDVNLDVCADCFCLGGFTFTIEYDASVLELTDVEQGAIISTGDFWYVNYDVAGPGTVRVTFINNLSDQNPNPAICGLLEEPIFKMNFFLNPYVDYPDDIDWCIPVCFMYDLAGENHYDFNNVSDPEGGTVWYNDGCQVDPDSAQNFPLELDFVCGNVKVMSDHLLLQGDVNLNGTPFDIGDAVALANYLGDPDAHPLETRAYYSADPNDDDIYASVADLIYIINVATGRIVAPKLMPLNVAATVSMPSDVSEDLRVIVNSEANVGGALVSINHTGVELGTPVAEGMDLQYSDNGDVMTVLVYNIQGEAYASGANVLFTVPVEGEGAVSFGDISVSDNNGALLDARTEISAPIPDVYSVNQNFPNPFNAKTSIAFGLPTDNNVTINIYNVAGQLVETMDLGHMFAGNHSVVWDASDVASGVYFYKVSAGNFNETMKMTLLK
jgi:hypothetical protein